MGKTPPITERAEQAAGELRALLREAHELMKEFRRERKEAAEQIATLRTLILDVTAEQMAQGAAERISEMHEIINERMRENVEKIDTEFMELRDLLMSETRKDERRQDAISLREAVEMMAAGIPVKMRERGVKFGTEIL